MSKIYLVLVSLVFLASNFVHARTFVRVKSIGSSPKGQFIAIEEFGYKTDRKQPYSKIRIINVWKNKYMGEAINAIGTNDEAKLKEVRREAMEKAKIKLKKFNISA